MRHNPIDKITITLVAAAICILAVLNLCQTDRPTVSETENRNLATMPEFTWNAVMDGSYFSGVSAFFSDTFLGRDWMVSVSKQMDRLKSLSIIHERDGISVIVDPNATKPPATTETLPTLPPWTPPVDPTTTLPTTPTTTPTVPGTTVPGTTGTTIPGTTGPTIPGTTGPTIPGTTPGNTTTKPTTPTTKPTVPVIPLLLDHTSLTMDAGAAATLVATVGKGYGNLSWKSSNTNVAVVSVNGASSVNVSAVSKGTATITATVKGPDGQSYSLDCTVTVKETAIERPDNVADFLPNGMIIYNGAAYSQSYFSSTVASSMAAIYERYALMFPNSTVSVVQAPLATITITELEGTKC